ncbi:MAG: hypothetical protein JEY79_15010 [Pseudodesulfovibrio sp.]|nr:hypothetical protein [Pseudodesulfovibrio sp.]
MTKNADVSKSVETQLSEDIPTLEAEIVELTQERERVIKSTREFLDAEDPAKGIFHNTEIHELKQEKLRIDVDIKFRSNKINRINLGVDGMGSELPKDGFVF